MYTAPHTKAGAFCVVYLELTNVADAWASGDPEDDHPWAIVPSRYAAIPKRGLQLVPMPPPEATIFSSYQEARAWRSKRMARYVRLGQPWRPAPLILPVAGWMLERLGRDRHDDVHAP